MCQNTISLMQLIICRVKVDSDPEANVTVGTFESGRQDFSFDSFVWNNPAVSNPNQFWITCTVYLCNDAADDGDCSDLEVQHFVGCFHFMHLMFACCLRLRPHLVTGFALDDLKTSLPKYERPLF